jgi:transcription antitermination factor NusG
MWHVLHVRPRCEKKLAEYCQVLAVEHYLPLRSETKVYQRRKVTVEKPVFPGYVFAAFDRVQRVNVLRTNQVVRIMEPESEERFLHELAQVRQALTADPTLASCLALREGQRVRITGGAFMGIEGWVHSLKTPAKVVLNVDIIGQGVAVEVGREFLEPLD